MSRLGQVLIQYPGFSGSGLLSGEFACPKASTPTEKPVGAQKPMKTSLLALVTGSRGMWIPDSPVQENLFRTRVTWYHQHSD